MLQNLIYEEIPFDDLHFPIRIHSNSTITPLHVRQLSLMCHEQLEILYFSKGGGVVECGFEKYLAEDEDVYIINPCEPHSVYYGKGNPLFDCIMIDPKIYSSTEKDICEMKYLKPMANHQICFNNLIRGNIEIIKLIKLILLEYKNKNFAYELSVKGNIQNILVCLFRNEIKSIQSQKEIKKNLISYTRMKTVFQYIEEHYDTEIPLETLANLCFLSQSHFCHLFKKVTGLTAVQYINEYRISKAEILLKTTDLSISDIAQKVGFLDSSYFSRYIKQIRNLTPMQIRNNTKNN